MNESVKCVLETKSTIQSAIEDFEKVCNAKELLELARKGEQFDETLNKLKVVEKKVDDLSRGLLKPRGIYLDDKCSEAFCPKCLHTIGCAAEYMIDESKYRPKFCEECGQALSWDNLD